MIRTARLLVSALLVTAPLHFGCSALLGYEDEYRTGAGAAGANASNVCDPASPKFRCIGAEIVQICNVQSSLYETGALCQVGERCDAQVGGCVANAGGEGGNAGSARGGSAGSARGGNAGNAGSAQGGSAGSAQGGNAGSAQGGNAGSAQGGNAGATAGGSGGSGPVNPTDCSVIYVRPGTAAAGDGCSPTAPVASLAAALSARQQQTKEIRICEGTLSAPTVQLDAPISLFGSYRCADWTRPLPVQVSELTTIVKSTQESAAIVVSSPSVGRATVIEGLQLVGASNGKKSRALSVTLGAQPTIRLNRIVGGKATGPDFPSLGAQVAGGAAPRLENNVIQGGEGNVTGASVASVGLLLAEDAGPAEIVGNTIEGGKATVNGQGYGSVGLFVLPLTTAQLIGAASVRDNVISGGDANDMANTVELLSIGVFLDETSAGQRGRFAFVGGSIRGSNAAHDGAPAAGRIPSAIGLHSGKHERLEIQGVRFYGGDSSEKTGSSIAVSLGGPGTTTIRSSILHGGGGLDTTPSPRAIETRQSGQLSIFGSTLFAGFPRSVSAGAASAKGIYTEGKGPIRLEGNLFVLQGGQGTALQIESGCSLLGVGDSVLAENAFSFSRTSDQRFLDGQSCSPGGGTTLASLEAIFSVAKQNLPVVPNASAPGHVPISCTNDATCVQAVVESYDTQSYGRSQTLDLLGRGPATKLCAVAKGTKASPDNATDLFGTPRPVAGAAIGAIEPSSSPCP